MTPATRHEQYLANEEHGRQLRSADWEFSSMLGTAVEIQPLRDRPDWSSMEYAYDVLYRAVRAANQAGLEGKTISGVSITGCTQYGNLILGWDFKTEGEPEATV